MSRSVQPPKKAPVCVFEDGVRGAAAFGAEGPDAGLLGAGALGLAVVRGGSGTWGFSTSFMSSVSERSESAGGSTSTAGSAPVSGSRLERKRLCFYLCSTDCSCILLRSWADTGSKGVRAGTEPRRSSCPWGSTTGSLTEGEMNEPKPQTKPAPLLFFFPLFFPFDIWRNFNSPSTSHKPGTYLQWVYINTRWRPSAL